MAVDPVRGLLIFDRYSTKLVSNAEAPLSGTPFLTLTSILALDIMQVHGLDKWGKLS